MGGLKFKIYDIAPRNYAKGITNIVDLDIDPLKIVNISGIIYMSNPMQAWTIPSVSIAPSTGDYNANYAVAFTLSNQTLRMTLGISWVNTGLHIVVGYVD